MEASNEEVIIQSHERRRDDRVDDEILMYWRIVKPDEIPEETPVDDNDDKDSVAAGSLSERVKLLSLETADLLTQIGQTDPLLAKYLTALERKVDALASLCILKDDSPTHSRSTRHVNLSVSGVAFLTEQGYPIGTLLELDMVFLPTLTSVIAYGRVIYSIRYYGEKPLSHRIGVGFIRLHNYDREMLSSHVHRCKSKEKGSQESH